MQGRMVLESHRFESVSVTTLPERVLAGFAGLICLLPAWEFFGQYRVNPFQLGYLPFWFIALAAGSMSIVLLAGAVIGGTRTVTVDATARTLEVSHRFWWHGRTRRWRFDELGPVAVIEDNSSDGPPNYELTIGRQRRKPVMLRRFSARADAEAAQVALQRILA